MVLTPFTGHLAVQYNPIYLPNIMKDPQQRFSRRHGYSETAIDITVRHDAPENLRQAIVVIAYEFSIRPKSLREIICSVLRIAPNQDNWSDYPDIDQEIQGILYDCKWYYIYDIIERIYSDILSNKVLIFTSSDHRSQSLCPSHISDTFANEINQYFCEHGIGWQLIEGQIEIRGSEEFEESIRKTHEILKNTAHHIASNELHEARLDLSRRPNPDVTGAIQHAMAGLECVARSMTENSTATLGEIIRSNRNLLPQPLDQAVCKIWGYASDRGRHLREDHLPEYNEAELIVGLSFIICFYLIQKNDIRNLNWNDQ